MLEDFGDTTQFSEDVIYCNTALVNFMKINGTDRGF
jgi:hypothetical protein